MYRLFSTTAYRLTGKKCNPHLVRDSVVTYLRWGLRVWREASGLQKGAGGPMRSVCWDCMECNCHEGHGNAGVEGRKGAGGQAVQFWSSA